MVEALGGGVALGVCLPLVALGPLGELPAMGALEGREALEFSRSLEARVTLVDLERGGGHMSVDALEARRALAMPPSRGVPAGGGALSAPVALALPP